MREKVKVRNEKGTLILYINATKRELVESHIKLRQKVEDRIEAGENTSPASVNECVTDLFVILFGEEGAKQLLDWYGGNHKAALDAISYYYDKKLIPRLKKTNREMGD